jgi:acetyl esterase/lipase
VIYPAILLTPERRSYLGLVDGKPNKQTLRELLPADNVTAQTPPTFIVHTTVDELVRPANSIAYYNALYAAHVPVEMHIFAQGRHGLGLAMSEPLVGAWPNLLWSWLNACGFIRPGSSTCVPAVAPAPTF